MSNLFNIDAWSEVLPAIIVTTLVMGVFCLVGVMPTWFVVLPLIGAFTYVITRGRYQMRYQTRRLA
jgi:hypothetical protein